MLHSQETRAAAPEMDSLRLGMGWKPDELTIPQVMVESTFGDSHPGSAHLLTLADAAMRGIRDGGARGSRYFTTDICDGIAQGHDGMNYSLASREMITGLIEIHNMASGFDAGVFIASCDKAVPAHLMAVGRLNIPSVIMTGGVMKAGPDLLTLEQIGAYDAMHERGEISEEQLTFYKHNCCPSCGACSFMGTACTMQIMAEALGLMLPGTALMPAVGGGLEQAAFRAGQTAAALAVKGAKPREYITRDSFENAVLIHAAISGSTNALLHIPAIAHEFGIDFPAEEFDRLQRNAPWLTDIRPAGKWPAEFLYTAGGVPAIIRELQPILHMDAMTVTGHTLAENLHQLEQEGWFERSDRMLAERGIRRTDIVRTFAEPIRRDGAIAVLKGSLAPDGSVVRHSSVPREMFKAVLNARPFNSEEEAIHAVLHGQIHPGDAVIIRFEGPKGSGMPEMFYTTEAIASDPELSRQIALITDGRFSGASRGPAIGHVSPEAASGGPLAYVEEGDLIALDIEGRRLDLVGAKGRRMSPAEVEELLARRRKEKPLPAPRKNTGVLRLFTQHAAAPMKGAYLE